MQKVNNIELEDAPQVQVEARQARYPNALSQFEKALENMTDSNATFHCEPVYDDDVVEEEEKKSERA